MMPLRPSCPPAFEPPRSLTLLLQVGLLAAALLLSLSCGWAQPRLIAAPGFQLPRLPGSALILNDYRPQSPWAISPDGRHVACAENGGEVLWLRIVNLVDRSVTRLPVGERDPGAERSQNDASVEAALAPFLGRTRLPDFAKERGIYNRVRRLWWKSNDRLVFETRGESQLWAIDLDGSNVVELLRYSSVEGSSFEVGYSARDIIDLLPVDPEAVLVRSWTLRRSRSAYHVGSAHRSDTYLVSTVNGNASPLVDGRMRGMLPYVDHLGFLRGGMRLDEDAQISELYLWDETKERAEPISKRIGQAVAERWGLRVKVLDPQVHEIDYLGWGFLPDVFHLVRPTDHGRSALYALDLSTLAAGTEVEPVMESGDFDLSSGHLVFDSPRQQIVGFRFEGVRETTVWFDDALAAVQTALDQSMPKRVNRIESWDRARERFVFRTLSERDRGGVGLFDRSGETARLEVLEAVDDENTERRSTIPVWVPLGSHQVLCYLTVPAAATPGVPQPMVLMVPDVTEQRALLKFDPMVQGLAAAGYAVLQVNPRGVPGFTGGHSGAIGAALTRGVIEDVTGVARWAREAGLADAQRLHLLGNGYGGYAALLASAEHPDLFTSVTSEQAVLDLWSWLQDRVRGMFNAPQSVELRNELTIRPWKGEDMDKKEILQRSPMARVDEINLPVLLLHGAENRRVEDSEPKGLQKRLERRGVRCDLHFIAGSAWGDWSPAEVPAVLEHVTAFLRSVDAP